MSSRLRKEGGTSNPVPVGLAKAVRSFQGVPTSEGPQICPTNGIAAEVFWCWSDLQQCVGGSSSVCCCLLGVLQADPASWQLLLHRAAPAFGLV